MSTRPPTIPLLHRSLNTGLVLLAGVFVFLRLRGVAPLSPTESGTSIVGYTCAALSIGLLLISLLLFKPRVPDRQPQQSIERYWAGPDVIQSVLVMWFLMEGAGVLAAIGYFMTGQPAPIAAYAIAVVVFWLNGPSAVAD